MLATENTAGPLPSFWTIAVALLGATVGLVGVFVKFLLDRIQDRDARLRRSRALDDAVKITTFWQSWLNSAERLGLADDEGAISKAKAQLQYAAEHVDAIVSEHRFAHTPRRDLVGFALERYRMPAWKRYLLLYKSPRRRAWIPRVLFYGYVINLAVLPFSTAYFTYRVVRAHEDERTAAQSDFNIAAATPPNPNGFGEDVVRTVRLSSDQRRIDNAEAAIAAWYHWTLVDSTVTIASSIVLGLLFRRLSIFLETPREEVPPEQELMVTKSHDAAMNGS